MAKTAAAKEWAYVAHPAAGLRYSGKREPHSPLPSKLGMRWLRLSREEQARRRRAFFSTLLEPWTAPGRARFAASGLSPEARAALDELPEAQLEGDGLAEGELTPEAAELLLRAAPAKVVVTTGERTLLDARGGWRRVLVLLEDEEAREVEERTRALDRELSARAARGPDRRRRAIALLAMHYVLLVAALGVAVGALTLLDSVLKPYVTIPAAIAAGFVFFSSLEPVMERALRWYGEG
ncbi:hypothetical protein [Conexibacter woesei]|uniref:Uncharacterized protein n=1 Tax=Conexibacter woesei (strain DSM 14684 / CCUG 47730 / CIP 108061 / JCM 11494 / NBRC 100937 / ID131577) TaxID=469383 RepID=D3EZY1_CONWI|nr:hypothetical protein [Conexibacter woesei]ADB49957.1 hypothetical protein Cwoe_1529 [Conexibacter woesei DSM 14684]